MNIGILLGHLHNSRVGRLMINWGILGLFSPPPASIYRQRDRRTDRWGPLKVPSRTAEHYGIRGSHATQPDRPASEINLLATASPCKRGRPHEYGGGRFRGVGPLCWKRFCQMSRTSGDRASSKIKSSTVETDGDDRWVCGQCPKVV